MKCVVIFSMQGNVPSKIAVIPTLCARRETEFKLNWHIVIFVKCCFLLLQACEKGA